MARVTVEDCLKKVPNRFELIVLASQRAQAILSGSKSLIERDDSPIVLALREIAESKVSPDALYDAIVQKYSNKDAQGTSYTSSGIPSFFAADDFDAPMDMGVTMDNGGGVEIDGSLFADQNLEVDD